MVSLDVIVPSFRLQSEYLTAIVSMDIPSEAKVRFLIISDNPQGKIPADFATQVDNDKVILIANEANYGVSKTRNIGIDKSTADWILFLDDDVKPPKDLLINYLKAIIERPGEVGFLGEVIFPESINSFTAGLRAGSILAGFSVARLREHSKCAATANVVVKRSAIGDVRFLEIYDKRGACEEADFFLRIYNNTKQELQCLTNTPVYHDWWNKGKRDYSRFIRVNGGAAILMQKFPQYSFYTFPNMVECFLVGLPLTLIVCFCIHSFLPILCVSIGVLAGEFIVEFMRLQKSGGLGKSKFTHEVIWVRAAIDYGRLKMQFQKFTIFQGISKRFDFFCNGKNINYQRFWAAIKFFAYLFISIGVYFLIKYLSR